MVQKGPQKDKELQKDVLRQEQQAQVQSDLLFF